MGCPLMGKCFWSKVNQEELARTSCEEYYESCIYYRLCKDSRDPEECTKAIYRYQHEVEGYYRGD